MSAPQSSLTIAAIVVPGEIDRLREVLAHANQDPGGNDVIPFNKLGATHYARFVVVDAAVDPVGAPAEALLLFMCDFDGSARRYVHHLVDAVGPGLDRIFSHCEDYPRGAQISRAKRLAFLRAHRVASDATYVNTIGRTVDQVLLEAKLRDGIERFLDRADPHLEEGTALSARAAIQQYVRSNPELTEALHPPSPLNLFFRLREAAHLAVLPIVVIALLPFLIVAVPLGLLLIRVREQSDPAPGVKPAPEHVAALRSAEDYLPQNQFSATGFFKVGRVRAVTARTVLLLVNYGVRHIFNAGNLAGVRTIHFARWVPLNDRRRMIFVSNYDGSLESYMDDFIDKLAWGLNAVFSNGVGYPRTRWLIFGGARDEQAFKDHLRRHQITTDVWYAAYATLTALNIETNARIRVGLSGEMTEAEARAWLGLL